MAKISLAWDKRPKKDGTMSVYIRVCHNYTEARVTTPWSITKNDLNKKGELKNQKVIDNVNEIMQVWRKKIEHMAMGGARITAKELVEFLTEANDKPWTLDFIAYVRADADALKADGHKGTAELRITSVRSFVEYYRRDSVDINAITTTTLNGWVAWLLRKKANRAASLYPTQLRAVFNKAKKEYNTDSETRIPNDPFSRMNKVRQKAPAPRSITVEQLRAIINMDTSGMKPRAQLARDVFVMSFLLMGMNAVDLYNCPRIKDGRITYERTKTRTRRDDKALISVAIPKEFTPYYIYIGKRKTHAFVFASRYSTRREFNAALNKGLKDIGKAINVEGLQFYAARHTWATIAVNDVGIDKYTVHTALNHVDPKTAVTDIYIRKSWEPLDKANRKVLDYVFNVSTKP